MSEITSKTELSDHCQATVVESIFYPKNEAGNDGLITAQAFCGNRTASITKEYGQGYEFSQRDAIEDIGVAVRGMCRGCPNYDKESEERDLNQTITDKFA